MFPKYSFGVSKPYNSYVIRHIPNYTVLKNNIPLISYYYSTEMCISPLYENKEGNTLYENKEGNTLYENKEGNTLYNYFSINGFSFKEAIALHYKVLNY